MKKPKFYSCVWLDSIFPQKIRLFIAKTLDIVLTLNLIVIFFSTFKLSFLKNFPIDEALKNDLVNLFFLVLSFRLILFALENFYRSKSGKKDYVDFESTSLAGKALFEKKYLSGISLLKTFIGTKNGKFFLAHLGIPPKDFSKFLEQNPVPEESTLKEKLEKIAEEKREINIKDLILAAIEEEAAISKFFFDLKIKKEHIAGALDWTILLSKKKQTASKWWSEENLAQIPGMGKNLSYGNTYILDQFSRSVAGIPNHQKISCLTGHKEQINSIETILSRSKQANVILVGEPGVGKRKTLAGFSDLIRQGKIRPELEYKRLLELDASSLFAAAKTKSELETLIIRILNDAVRAGNIILVIDNFAEFINSAETSGISLVQTIGPYLSSSDFQLIAISDSSAFKRKMEPNSSLMQYFETVKVEEPNTEQVIQILQDISLGIEAKEKITILYQTILEIINATNSYLTEGAMPERAIDVLEIISSRAAGAGKKIVSPKDVSDFVSQKTKMPLGNIETEEKEKLLHLEDFLHKRVINQKEAISAIANAARRARAGIVESKKPIASFLFLGPTGVGKTETAKALTETYFGDEKLMTRFDMSEYQHENALERLIGSFEKNQQGILATTSRERPYGLLLLDELEKCDQKVLDLFLQILDEGFFTDAFGRKVFLRNRIIIATSNAGSQMIWELGKKGLDPATLKEKIIDEIQQKGIFKAELLNRFNGVIIFHHLSRENLKEIAKLMLEKLKKRLLKKEMELIINDALIEKIVEIGYDPLFGARPMERAIQEKIEKKIAEGIIAGTLKRGSKIEFSPEDLKNI